MDTEPPSDAPRSPRNNPDEDITDWVMAQSVADLRRVVRDRFCLEDPETHERVPNPVVTDEDITSLVAFLRRAKRARVTWGEYLEREGTVRETINLRHSVASGVVKETAPAEYEGRYVVHQIVHGDATAILSGPLVATITRSADDQFQYRLHSYAGPVRQGSVEVHVEKNGDVDIAESAPRDWRTAQAAVHAEFVRRYNDGDETIHDVVARFITGP